MLSWLSALFTSAKAAKAIAFSVKVITLFEGYEKKDQNLKNATIDTFIELLQEHKKVIPNAS